MFTLIGAAVALVAIVLVRCLIGLWQGSDLPRWPGHRAASVVLVAAALACAPVAVGQTRPEKANLAGFNATMLVLAIAPLGRRTTRATRTTRAPLVCFSP